MYLFLDDYRKNDEEISKISGVDFSELYRDVFEPSLYRLLDQIANITQFILDHITYLNHKVFIRVIEEALSAFESTVFDSTSRDYNRDYLRANYETLKILLFLVDKITLEDLF
jgi:hypothetical protein